MSNAVQTAATRQTYQPRLADFIHQHRLQTFRIESAWWEDDLDYDRKVFIIPCHGFLIFVKEDSYSGGHLEFFAEYAIYSEQDDMDTPLVNSLNYGAEYRLVTIHKGEFPNVGDAIAHAVNYIRNGMKEE